MSGAKARALEEYLAALEDRKSEKPEQVREGIEAYLGPWRKAIETVSSSHPKSWKALLRRSRRKAASTRQPRSRWLGTRD
jgi:hypothetical protein